jgi:hypothetical protein
MPRNDGVDGDMVFGVRGEPTCYSIQLFEYVPNLRDKNAFTPFYVLERRFEFHGSAECDFADSLSPLTATIKPKAMRAVKDALDSKGILNPGQNVHPLHSLGEPALEDRTVLGS